MGVLTESELRAQLKNKKLDKYVVTPEVLITPSARQYLKDRNIELVVEEKIEEVKEEPKGEIKDNRMLPKYKCTYSGGFFEKKPEYMTQLYGNKLVYKDHPRIILRGRIDSLEAKILEVQILAVQLKAEKLLKDLQEILQFVRNILRAEVLEEKLPELKLLGLNDGELREMSHHPNKYFNIGHIIPGYEMGEMVIALNSIRSMVRETEIQALRAFKKDDGIEREDIILAFNRLSSCMYILMIKFLAGLYK